MGGFPDARRSVERRLDIRHSAHFARYCPSAFEIGGGHAQVGIGGERTFDQRVESWIVIEPPPAWRQRSEEHTSELQSLMRISYAVFCLKKKKIKNDKSVNQTTKHTTN